MDHLQIYSHAAFTAVHKNKIRNQMSLGAVVGRQICDQEVAGSIPDRRQLCNVSGQVAHTHMPRRRQSLLLYGAVKPGTFTFSEVSGH